MLSTRQIKLTDLPLPILGRIVAAVDEGRQCTVASFPFQRIYDVDCPMVLDRSIWSSCRALRDAVHLAIGGININCQEAELIDTELEAPEKEPTLNNDRMPAFTLKTLLSLPCLRELIVKGNNERSDAAVPDAVAKALELLTGLKRLQLRGDVVGERWHLSAFPSSTTIEELELEYLDERFAKRLLSFQYNSSPSLIFYKLVVRPSIPKGILTTVRSFTLGECQSTELAKMYLKSLAKAPRLETLSLEETGSRALADLWQAVRFDAATTLNLLEVEFWMKGLDSNWSMNFAKVFQNGCFPNLRKFGLPGYAPRYGFSLRDFSPALAAACGRKLRELHIKTHNCLREDDVSVLKALDSHCAFELHLTVVEERAFAFVDGSDSSCSVANIASLSCLTRLTVSDRSVCNIQELSKSPNLRELTFSGCVLSPVELPELKNSLGTIKEFVLENCKTSASP